MVGLITKSRLVWCTAILGVGRGGNVLLWFCIGGEWSTVCPPPPLPKQGNRTLSTPQAGGVGAVPGPVFCCQSVHRLQHATGLRPAKCCGGPLYSPSALCQRALVRPSGTAVDSGPTGPGSTQGHRRFEKKQQGTHSSNSITLSTAPRRGLGAHTFEGPMALAGGA